LSLDSEIRTGYLWNHKVLWIGPVIGVALPWSTITIDEPYHYSEEISWWSLRILAGLAARIFIGQRLALDMGATAGVYPFREVFFRESDSKTVYQTPRWVMGARLGFLVFWKKRDHGA
jgi:hypothetical protein